MTKLDEIVNLTRFQTDDPYIGDDLLDLIKMLEAAKRGLSAANKLKNPEEKKKHIKNVFTNLNKIRAQLQKTLNKL